MKENISINRENISINRKRISDGIVFLFIYGILASAHSSMTFEYNFYIEFFSAIICLLYFLSKSVLEWKDSSFVAALMLLVSSAYTLHGGSIPGYISSMMRLSLAIVLLFLRDSWRIELMNTISRWFSTLLAISIIAWLINFVIPLPHITSSSESAWGYIETSHNYFFFKITQGIFDIQRFQAMFLEPGHMGTIVAFFLIINRFDFKKKYNLIFLVAAVLSMSASAYVLVVLGYVLYRYSENGSKRLIIVVLILSAIIIFFQYYNGGDNMFNNLIVEKLMREEGIVQSRVSLDIMTMYEDMWRTGKDLLWGKTMFIDVSGGVGAGIILYFVQNGIVGTSLLILAYFYIFKSCKSKYGLYVLIIFYVSFLQRTYPYWDAYTIPFVLGLPYFLNEQRIKERQKNLYKIVN